MDKTFFFAILSLSIPLAVGIITWFAYKFQVQQYIANQLSEKAKECNSYLTFANIDRILRDSKYISGHLAAIISAEDLLSMNLRGKDFLGINRQFLIDCFYLQIHTTIRTAIKDKSFIENANEHNATLITQADRVYKFLKESSLRYDY